MRYVSIYPSVSLQEAWTTAFEDRVKEHIAKKMMEKDPASVGQKRGPKVKMDGHRYPGGQAEDEDEDADGAGSCCRGRVGA
eukprot:9471442-Pyramimonas_sp.AAC.1